jgi:hypothetical protein
LSIWNHAVPWDNATHRHHDCGGYL